MRKLFYALAMIMAGAFMFAGSPAKAATAAAPASGIAHMVKSDGAVENVHYRRRHWRRRRHFGFYPYYYRPYYYRPYYYYRPHRRHRHRRYRHHW